MRGTAQAVGWIPQRCFRRPCVLSSSDERFQYQWWTPRHRYSKRYCQSRDWCRRCHRHRRVDPDGFFAAGAAGRAVALVEAEVAVARHRCCCCCCRLLLLRHHHQVAAVESQMLACPPYLEVAQGRPAHRRHLSLMRLRYSGHFPLQWQSERW